MEKELLVIYVTKEQKEIHRDRNPLHIPRESDLVTFKNIDAPHIFGDIKEKLLYVADVEFQVPDIVIVTLIDK